MGASDLGDPNQAQADSFEKDQRFQMLVEQAADGFFLHEPDGRLIMVNQQACQSLGYSREELLTMNVGQIDIRYQDQAYLQKELQQVKLGEPRTFESELRRKDGSTFPTEVHLSLVELGPEPKMLALVRDITERKAAEKALQDSERFGFLLADATFEGIAISIDGIIVETNRSFGAILGFPADEIVGRPALDFVHEDDREIVYQNMKQGRPGPYEHRARRKDGSIVYLEIQARQVFYQGSPARVTAIRDITERIRADQALRESEERCRQLVEASPSFILAIQDGRFVFSNPAGAQLLGASHPSQVEGKAIMDAISPKSRDLIMQRLENLSSTKSNPPREIEMLRMDGSTVVVESASVPIKFNGKDAALVIGQEIWERKNAERSLRESEIRFRELFENMRSGVAVYEAIDQGRDFVFRDLNRAGERMLRRSREELYGKRATECLPGLVTMGLLDVFQFAWKTDETQYHPVAFYQDERLTAWFESFVYKLPTGEIVSVFDDLAEQKQAEQERQEALEQLRQSQKMEAIGKLAGGIAHDFNNLLQVMRGYTELAIEQSQSTKTTRNLNLVLTAAERSATLIDQLLAFSRRQVLNLEVLNLHEAMEPLLEMLRRVIGENIHLAFSSQSDLNNIRVDRGQIEQIIVNLCVNAKEAIADDGTISIRLENASLDRVFCEAHSWAESGDYVLLKVADTGCGMVQEIQQNIFEPFFTTKDVDQGTGLGLSTVYGLVKQHKGLIRVESQPDQGSVFEIYLPSCEEASTARVTTTETLPTHGNETILVAEDEEMVLDLACHILKRAGYSVYTAKNGKQALEVFQTHADEISLALLDVVMPELNGREVKDRIRLSSPNLPILYTSGYNTDSILPNQVTADRIRFIRKPYRPKELLANVRELLDE